MIPPPCSRAAPAAWLVLCLCLCLFLTGCGPSVPQIDKLDSAAVVLAFGDSLTFGTGASPAESYPARLEHAIGRKVVNAGVPGEISTEGLKRLPEVLDEVKPKLLILCHGGNDFLRKMGEAETAANIRSMIGEANGRGIAVVLLATPKPGLPPSVPAFYTDTAQAMQIPIESEVIKSVLFNNAQKSDLVHPNATGYARMAEALATLLRKAGAI